MCGWCGKIERGRKIGENVMEIGILGTREMKGNGCDEKYKWGREIK